MGMNDNKPDLFEEQYHNLLKEQMQKLASAGRLTHRGATIVHGGIYLGLLDRLDPMERVSAATGMVRALTDIVEKAGRKPEEMN